MERVIFSYSPTYKTVRKLTPHTHGTILFFENSVKTPNFGCLVSLNVVRLRYTFLVKLAFRTAYARIKIRQVLSKNANWDSFLGKMQQFSAV